MGPLNTTLATLKTSDQAQSDSTQMVKTQQDRLDNQTWPAIDIEKSDWQTEHQAYLSSGCPDEGTVEQATYARCQPEHDKLQTALNKLAADTTAAQQTQAKLDAVTQAVTATTVDNAQKEKAINAQESGLMAQQVQMEATKAGLEATLEGFKNDIDSCAAVLRPQSGMTCEKIKAQCGNIPFDGQDKDLPASTFDSPCNSLPKVKPSTGMPFFIGPAD